MPVDFITSMIHFIVVYEIHFVTRFENISDKNLISWKIIIFQIIQLCTYVISYINLIYLYQIDVQIVTYKFYFWKYIDIPQ